MKKVIALVMALVLVVAFAACGENPPAPVDDKVNVVLVVPNSLGDKAFSDMIWAGVTNAKEKYDLGEVKCIELQGDTTTPVPTLTELCELGTWDIIVTGTFSLKESIEKVAAQFPEQKFVIYDTELDYTDGKFANCSSFAALQNEGSFLGGALAALMSETGVVGFVGGKETTSVSDFLVGYIEGAKYVNPDVIVRSAFIGSFTDVAKGKELALAQNSQQADVVFAVCSGAGLGVYEAAKENGFWAIGVDSDQSLILEASSPEMAKAILTSVVKNFDVILCNAIGDIINDNFTWGSHYAIDLAAGGIGLSDNSYYQAAVSEEIRAQIAELSQKITNGEIKVSTAIGMDADTYAQLKESASK